MEAAFVDRAPPMNVTWSVCLVSIYLEPIGAGGTGAPSRVVFAGRRCLLAPVSFGESLVDSLAGLLFASLPDSAGFLSLLLAGAGAKEAGCGAIWGAALAAGPGRGQAKSSARPAGADSGSPRLKTFAARGSASAGLVRAPAPARSPLSASSLDNGSTGPTSGWAPTVPDFGAASGAGSATGAIWLDITRRRSWST